MSGRLLLIASCYTLMYLITLGIYAQDPTTTVQTIIESDDEELEVFDRTQPYCFRFTWLGPDYDNSTWKTVQNMTCKAYVDTKKLKNTPCYQPLVITYDGTPPDMQHLWDTYKMRVACKRTNGLTCAKYSYLFNGGILNVTYMCTKVFADGEGAVTSGCYSQMVNGEKVELCVCESGKGDYRPCNGAVQMSVPVLLLLFVAIKYVF